MRALAVCAAGVVAVSCNKSTTAPPPPLPGQIAFVSDRGRFGSLGNVDIFLMSANGTGITDLTDVLTLEDWPAWSADGSKIAFTSNRGFVPPASPDTLDIFVMNADGTGVVQLTTDTTQESEPTWSPDGTRIAFVSNRDHGINHIFVMHADGTNVVQLTSGLSADALPAWSPDGSKIAFTTQRTGNDEVFVMDTTGANLVNLSNDPQFFDDAPAWSPDGSKIAFMSNRNTQDLQIWVMNADGSNVVQITSGTLQAEYPTWSPDGVYIACDRGQHIWVAKADGSLQAWQITSGSFQEFFPRWRP